MEHRTQAQLAVTGARRGARAGVSGSECRDEPAGGGLSGRHDAVPRHAGGLLPGGRVAVGERRPGADHRVRQRRRPADGARRPSPTRDRHPRGDWRRPRTGRAGHARGEFSAGPGRGRRGADSRCRRRKRSVVRDVGLASGCDDARSARAALRTRPGCADHALVRPGPGSESHRRRRGQRSAARRRRRDRAALAAARARRGSGGPLVDADRPRTALRAKPDLRGQRRSRVRHRPRRRRAVQSRLAPVSRAPSACAWPTASSSALRGCRVCRW